MTRLKVAGMVAVKVTPPGTIVTICKYEEYNDMDLGSGGHSGGQRREYKNKEVQEQVPKRPQYPPWAHAILDDWKSVHELPSNASEQACLKVIHDLHRIDKKAPELIAAVCAFIVRNKVPTYIKSPMKLRQKTRTGDQQTFEMYEWEVGKKAPPPQRERRNMRQVAAEKNARQRAALEEAGINAPNR